MKKKPDEQEVAKNEVQQKGGRHFDRGHKSDPKPASVGKKSIKQVIYLLILELKGSFPSPQYSTYTPQDRSYYLLADFQLPRVVLSNI